MTLFPRVRRAPAKTPAAAPAAPPASAPAPNSLPEAILANTPINALNQPPAPVSPPAKVVIDVAAEADVTAEYLKRPAEVIESACNTPNVTADLPQHREDVTKAVQLINRVRHRVDLQTPTVGTALLGVKVVAEELDALLSEGLCAPGKLANVIDKLVNATVNLNNSLPGDIVNVLENEVEDGQQLNGVFGKTAEHRRINAEIQKNKVKGANAKQVNGAIFGKDFNVNAFFGQPAVKA